MMIRTDSAVGDTGTVVFNLVCAVHSGCPQNCRGAVCNEYSQLAAVKSRIRSLSVTAISSFLSSGYQ